MGQGSLAGRQTPPPKKNYPCLCFPLSGYALQLALNWLDTGAVVLHRWAARGRQAFPPGLTRLLAGCAQSAPSGLMNCRLQVSTQYA